MNVNYWLKVHIQLKMDEFDLAMAKNKIHLTWQLGLYDICNKLKVCKLSATLILVRNLEALYYLTPKIYLCYHN